MMTNLKSYFTKPTAKEQADLELAEAESALLIALSSQEYFASMAKYQAQRVTRLKEYVKA